MKQSYIQHIEKTVRAKCPELQELSLWCKVKNKELGFIYPILYKTYWGWAVLAGNAIEIREDLLEIIGHDIQLQHILRTMGDKYILWFDGLFMQMTWTIQQEWQYWEYCYTPVREIINERIDFIQFNLSISWKDQEEPVLKFLAETMGFNQ